jgi:drug/metabolite transporter (DMT)-like permease
VAVDLLGARPRAPAAALGVWVAGVPPLRTVSTPAWLGFGYVSLVSALLGFFAWYRGMALGGIARVSQTQLLQPVLSVAWAALLLGEPLAPETIGAAALGRAVRGVGAPGVGARSARQRPRRRDGHDRGRGGLD